MNSEPMEKSTAPAESIFWAKPRWAAVEIKGFRQRLGLCSEVEQFGAKMLRIDIPQQGDVTKMHTEFYPGSSLHAVTLVSEEYAMTLLDRDKPKPALEYSGDRNDDEDEDEALFSTGR